MRVSVDCWRFLLRAQDPSLNEDYMISYGEPKAVANVEFVALAENEHIP